MCRDSQRAEQIRAQLERHESGSQRRGSSAGGAARRAREIPRIARSPINGIDALPIAEISRDIGLADDDCPARFEAGYGDGIMQRPRRVDARYTPGRRQPRDIERLLDGHRHAEQRAPISPGQCGIGGNGGRACPLEVPARRPH